MENYSVWVKPPWKPRGNQPPKNKSLSFHLNPVLSCLCFAVVGGTFTVVLQTMHSLVISSLLSVDYDDSLEGEWSHRQLVLER